MEEQQAKLDFRPAVSVRCGVNKCALDKVFFPFLVNRPIPDSILLASVVLAVCRVPDGGQKLREIVLVIHGLLADRRRKYFAGDVF